MPNPPKLNAQSGARRLLPHPPTTPRAPSRPSRRSEELQLRDQFMRHGGRKQAWPPRNCPDPLNKYAFVLNTKEKRADFFASWDKLQSDLQLFDIDECETSIADVTLKGEDALAMSACKSLAAYFEAFHYLTFLENCTKDMTPATKNNLQKIFMVANKNFNDLSEIVQLESIKKYWIGTSKAEMVLFFQKCSGIFWKNAASQRKPFECFLAKFNPEMIKEPGSLKESARQTTNQIKAALLPYKWSENSFCNISNIAVNKKIAAELFERLKPETINLNSPQGAKDAFKKIQLLEDIMKQVGDDGVSLRINGVQCDTSAAIAALMNQFALYYADTSNRYLFLQQKLTATLRQDELQRAVKSPHLLTDISEDLATIRSEMVELRNLLRHMNSNIAKNSILSVWEQVKVKQVDLEQARDSVRPYLLQKIPFAEHEKSLIKQNLAFYSNAIAFQEVTLDDEITHEQEKWWNLAEMVLDSKKLEQIFYPKPFGQLEWVLNSRAPKLQSQDLNSIAWLKTTMASSARFIRQEWTYLDNLKKIKTLLSSPDFSGKIYSDRDRRFFSQVSARVNESVANQQLFAEALNEAFNLTPLSEEEFHTAQVGGKWQAESNHLKPIDNYQAIIRLCNIHSTSSFHMTMSDNEFFLDEEIVSKWLNLTKKYKLSFTNNLEQQIPAGILIANFRNRIHDYPSFWQNLKASIPKAFEDAISLTYLRIKVKTDEISRKQSSESKADLSFKDPFKLYAKKTTDPSVVSV